jgi:hypothetical protein
MATAIDRRSPRSPGLAQTWHFIVKYGPAIVVVIGALWQGATYLISRNDQAVAEQRRLLIEARKPFLDKQLALYTETTEVAGLLFTLPLPTAAHLEDQSATKDWSWARRRFPQLFWNELPMVEDKAVEGAMGDFSFKLHEVETCIRDTAPQCDGIQAQMAATSRDLASAIRASIKDGWGFAVSEGQPAKSPALLGS